MWGSADVLGPLILKLTIESSVPLQFLCNQCIECPKTLLYLLLKAPKLGNGRPEIRDLKIASGIGVRSKPSTLPTSEYDGLGFGGVR